MLGGIGMLSGSRSNHTANWVCSGTDQTATSECARKNVALTAAEFELLERRWESFEQWA